MDLKREEFLNANTKHSVNITILWNLFCLVGFWIKKCMLVRILKHRHENNERVQTRWAKRGIQLEWYESAFHECIASSINIYVSFHDKHSLKWRRHCDRNINTYRLESKRWQNEKAFALFLHQKNKHAHANKLQKNTSRRNILFYVWCNFSMCTYSSISC